MFRRGKPPPLPGTLPRTLAGTLAGDENEDDTYTWMVRLAERLARRDRLCEMNAPQTIVDAELNLVERAKAKLTAAQILFVLSRRDEVIRFFDPADGLEGAAVPDKATDPS
jgi:hypothetical protein